MASTPGFSSKELALQLKKQRWDRGISREELAKACQVSPRDYASLENGRKPIPAATLAKALTAIGVSMDDFIEGCETDREHRADIARRSEDFGL